MSFNEIHSVFHLPFSLVNNLIKFRDEFFFFNLDSLQLIAVTYQEQLELFPHLALIQITNFYATTRFKDFRVCNNCDSALNESDLDLEIQRTCHGGFSE